MGQAQKSTMETRFVGPCKRWMVASKHATVSGTDDGRLEPKMKKNVIDAVEDYLEKCAQVIVKNCFGGKLANARKPRGLLKVRLETRKFRV